MAVITRMELHRLTGIDRRKLCVYAQRQTYIEFDRKIRGLNRPIKYIDTDDPINSEFIAKWQEINNISYTVEDIIEGRDNGKPGRKRHSGVKPPKIDPNRKIAPEETKQSQTKTKGSASKSKDEPKKTSKKKPADRKQIEDDIHFNDEELIEAPRKRELTPLQKLEMEKKKLEMQKLEIANAKALGNLIPLNLVMSYQGAVIRQVVIALEREMENWIGDSVSIMGGSNEDRTDGLNRLKNALNLAMDHANAEMSKQIQIITSQL